MLASLVAHQLLPSPNDVIYQIQVPLPEQLTTLQVTVSMKIHVRLNLTVGTYSPTPIPRAITRNTIPSADSDLAIPTTSRFFMSSPALHYMILVRILTLVTLIVFSCLMFITAGRGLFCGMQNCCRMYCKTIKICASQNN